MSKDVITVLAFVSSGVESPFAIFAGLDVELRGRSLERASLTREDTLPVVIGMHRCFGMPAWV